jgi:hypothetical protein
VRVSLAVLAVLAFSAGCGSQRNTLERLWHQSGQAVALIPGDADFARGDVRFSFLVVANDGRPVTRPTAQVWVADNLKAEPDQQVTAHLERIGVPGGYTGLTPSIYVAHLRLPKPGTYWVLARPVGGDFRIGGIKDLQVRPQTASPAVGSPAPASKTPTLGSAPIRLLTTHVPPDRALLRYSVAGSLADHAPFVVTFATPRYCTSRTCGPSVDVVNAVRKRFARKGIRFIHVEVYQDNNPVKGNNVWFRQWRLPSEPWTFLVGRDGRIKAKFEGAVSFEELERSVQRYLA